MKKANDYTTLNDLTAFYIANFLIQKGIDDNIEITNLKLNKLVYICLGFSLSLLKYNLFKDNVEAWDFGHVIPAIYFKCSTYGRKPIKEHIEDYKGEFDYEIDEFAKGEKYKPSLEYKKNQSYYNPVTDLLSQVWDVYKGFSPSKLVTLTHKNGTPWSEALKTKDKVISKELIKSYYDLLVYGK